MKPIFDLVKIKRPESNLFDLSHEKKLTANFGKLVPILVQDVVPGDKFKVKSELFIRLAPMLAPIMHRIDAYVHYFFVPNRLVYNQWEDFLTGGDHGTETPTFPTMEINTTNKASFLRGSLADYMGLPVTDGITTVTNPATISAIPFRAYQLIYNEYYRDQNLQDEIAFSKAGTLDSGDVARLCTLRTRAWEKDYFTSALTSTQKGNPSMLDITNTIGYRTETSVVDSNTNTTPVGAATVDHLSGKLYTDESASLRIENIDTIASSVSVNDLRRAVRIQEWLEKSALAGSRYIEHILVMFGVKSSDARLQRPEYLGGGKCPVTVSEVLQNSAQFDTNENLIGSPVGQMYGHGIAIGDSNEFERYFEEHGYIIGILSVLPKASYMTQGIEKHFTKTDKFDFYYPVFANLGEQEVKTGELFHNLTGTSGQHNTTFGYQSRYAEYKFRNSTVHADFRESLDHWHMSRKFTENPVLNEAFIQCAPTHHPFAVETESVHKCYIQVWNDVKAIRLMPIFGTPSL